MQRPDTGIRVVTSSDQARRLARAIICWWHPVGAPGDGRGAGCLGAVVDAAYLEAQGLAVGLCVSGARATSGVAEMLTRTVAPADAPLPRQLVARAALGGAGAALAAVPERDGQQLWVAS
jgi:hypothetical protein